MMNHPIAKPELLKLYHGTVGLIGDKIELRSDSGVGWNKFTLGNGFYTSMDINAAMLFSHISMIKHALKCDNKPFESPKVYQICLKQDIRLLDGKSPLDAKGVRGILLRAGISKHYLSCCYDDQLDSFQKASTLLSYAAGVNGNSSEYLVKALGFDGLKILEPAWESFDYWPDGIGVNWKRTHEKWKIQPPQTVIIYNTEMISRFSEMSVITQHVLAYHSTKGLDAPDELSRVAED